MPKIVWIPVASFDPDYAAEGRRIIFVGQDDSVYLVVGTGESNGSFLIRKLHDRTPDFGLAAFLRAGDDIGWPDDGFDRWRLLHAAPHDIFAGHHFSDEPGNAEGPRKLLDLKAIYAPIFA